MKKSSSKVNILGVRFWNVALEDSIQEFFSIGGLMTVPSGPGLASIPRAPVYYDSLLKSDFVLPDSGYMVLIWNLISRRKVRRISGLEFIDYFLNYADKKSRVFLVDPSQEESNSNLELLRNHGFNQEMVYSYLAPFYGKNQLIEDSMLLKKIQDFRPDYIMVNLGGNTQEILGLYIKNNVESSPLIICTGAAIAFKTGRQVRIPMWADKLFLGWLFRCISKPSVYIPRYLASFKLIYLLLKYRDRRVTSVVS